MSVLAMDRQRLKAEAMAVLRLALPLILAQLAAIGSNVVDTLLAGHYSAHVLGAVSVGTNIWVLAIVFGTGIMLSVPPAVAQLDGAGRRREVGAVLVQALWLALVLGVLLGWLIWHSTGFMAWVGAVPSLRSEVTAFLHAIAWGAPALTCYFTLRGLSEGLGLTRPSMYFSLGGLVILIPLGYVLMNGKLGLPPQGAYGCGLATALVLWLEMLGLAFYLRLHPAYRGLDPKRQGFAPRRSEIAALLRVGVPMAISLSAEVGLFVAVSLLLSRLGETTIAAHQIALNISSCFFMVPLGLAMAVTVRVGHAAGRGDAQGVRYAGVSGMLLAVGTQLLSTSLSFGLPHFLVGIYTRDDAVRALAAQLLMLAGVFQLADGIQVAANGALRGLKDTRVPMLLVLISYWLVGMPIGWSLAFWYGWGAHGMWVGMICGLSCAAVALFWRFWRISASKLVVVPVAGAD